MKDQFNVNPSVRENWTIATADKIESLSLSDRENLHLHDPFAWLLQQAGRLGRGESDRIDHDRLSNYLLQQADALFDQWKRQCCEVVLMLLLLFHSQHASREDCRAWKHTIRLNRSRMALTLYSNPAMKRFVDAMIDFSWEEARLRAAKTLTAFDRQFLRQHFRLSSEPREQRNWSQSLPARCPWSPREIVGFDPSDPQASLVDPTILPFTHRAPRSKS